MDYCFVCGEDLDPMSMAWCDECGDLTVCPHCGTCQEHED